MQNQDLPTGRQVNRILKDYEEIVCYEKDFFYSFSRGGG